MPQPAPPICLWCKHRHGERRTMPKTCDAFPTGIPDAILTNRMSHLKPIAGDGGIRFAAVDREGAEAALDIESLIPA